MKTQVTILVLFLSISSFGQAPIFPDNSSIVVHSDPLYGFTYTHELKAKQTIYSLAKVFDTSVNDIYQLNLKDKDYVFQIHENVKIPFQAFTLITDNKDLQRYEAFVEVLYAVKPKDNLFRISRVLFPQSMDHLIENNNMSDYNLDIGDELIVGWLPLSEPIKHMNPDPISSISIASINHLKHQLNYDRKSLENLELELKQPKKSLPLTDVRSSKNDEILKFERELETNTEIETAEAKTKVELTKSTAVLKHNSGVAMWDKKISDRENLFVLHKTAKVNTMLEIYYPLLDRHVQAQVVGNIPKGLYSNEIDLIISHKVAHQLGVRDARFRVEMKYFD